MIEMVRIGEHTGDIAGSLRRTADRCGRELSKSLDKAMAMVQPVIILIMAALVGTMAYVMISVISQTVSSIRR
jgi:type II secretory pathway component PulF